MPAMRCSESATHACFACELRLVGEILEAATAARRIVRARSLDARRAGREHLGRDRLGMTALHFRDAGAHGVTGKPGAHEDDEAVQARDTVPAEGERVDLELELLVACDGRRHPRRVAALDVVSRALHDVARAWHRLRPPPGADRRHRLKCALNFAFAGRYGWQRDELYYAVAGRHLQGGYVEFPPVTALLSAARARLVRLVAGRVPRLRDPRRRGDDCRGRARRARARRRNARAGDRRDRGRLLAAAGRDERALPARLVRPDGDDGRALARARIALGRGSWPLLGLAAGVGLETKYTLAVVLVLLFAALLVWRRDAARSRGFPLALGIAAALLCAEPVLGGASRLGERPLVRATRLAARPTSRGRSIVADLFLLTNLVAVPVAVAGVASARTRPRACGRSAGPSSALSSRTSCSAASRTTRCPRSSSHSPRARCRSIGGRRARRLRWIGAAFVALLIVLLPVGLPVLPLHTATASGSLKARSDYQDELGWPELARAGRTARARQRRRPGKQLRRGRRARAVRTRPAAGRLRRRQLPLLATRGRGPSALLVGFTRGQASFCHGYRLVGRIAMPVDNGERGHPIARCTLTASLAQIWPRILVLPD